MGVCRKIWQQKEGPNMLELCVEGVGGWRGWLIKERCGHGGTKRGRKRKVNYRDLDEVTECWEENSRVEGCLRLLNCSWDEVMEAQLLYTFPGLELKRRLLITQPDLVCAPRDLIHLLLYWTHWLEFDWTVTGKHLKPDCRFYSETGKNPVLSGRWVWWSQESIQTLSLQDKMWVCRLNRNTETHMEPSRWHRVFHQLQWTWRTRPAQRGAVEVYTLLGGRPLLGVCVYQPNCKTSLGNVCIRCGQE